jgi:hypothetical protein
MKLATLEQYFVSAYLTLTFVFYINPLKPKLIYIFSPYLKENITIHHYKDKLANAVYGNNRCLRREPYKTHKLHTKIQRYNFL